MKAINSGIRNAGRPENLEPVAKTLARDIRKRTRKGKEIDKLGGNERNFKPLAKNTIKKRTKSKLSKFTTPTTSNQTFKNKMVKSLKGETKRNIITLSVDKDQEKKLLNNRKLGRNFLQLSKKNLKTIVTRIGRFISSAAERDIN